MRKIFSIAGLSLKRRLGIAISLVSLIPVVILFYFLHGYYISFLAALVLIFVMFLGWLVVFEISSSITKVCRHSETTLKDIGGETSFVPDEVKNLESIIGLLSDKIRSGFEQLKEYTKKTEELNNEVSKKVFILSTILQANDLFSKNTSAEEVTKFLNYRLKQLLEIDVCFCILKREEQEELKAVAYQGVDSVKIKNFLSRVKNDLPQLKKILILDKNKKAGRYLSWAEDLGMKDMVAAPIILKGQIVGMVGAGCNKDKFSFSKDDLDVVNLFSQNITFIWENEKLLLKVEELEIFDGLTDLFNKKMIVKRLNEEIERATIYQRPCGFIMMQIADYDDYQKKAGIIEAEGLFKKIAKAFKRSLRPVDIAGRIGPNALGAILIESNKRQSQRTADALNEELGRICQGKVKLVFSIAESPIHGITAQELMLFAQTRSDMPEDDGIL